MAVTITKVNDDQHGAGFNVTLSAVNDVVQISFEPESDYPVLDWEKYDVFWTKTANVSATYTAGPRSDVAVTGGVGVSGGNWLPHLNTDKRTDVEFDPITGLRFKATAANQSVTLWTRKELKENRVLAVTGV